VCAYINGAVIFSTCVVDKEQLECYVDADCTSDDARVGFCVEGYCVDESGCLEDADCPTGFVCERLETDLSSESDAWYGTCVPRDVECDDDTPCPDDMYCEQWCYGDVAVDACDTSDDCPDNYECREEACWPIDCDSSDSGCRAYCGGICQSVYQNPCEEMDCATGTHCEVVDADCDTTPCLSLAECVPDVRECTDDDDCPDGFACIEQICPATPCTEERCPPCYGVCEPVDATSCESDEDCASDEVCEPYFEVTDCDTADCVDLSAVRGLCVAAPSTCANNNDCATGSEELGYCVDSECIYQFDCELSHAVCDMVEPTCPDGQVITVLNGCYGPCVDPSACESTQSSCLSKDDCPSLHECLVYCPDCVGDPGCTSNCEGLCVPVEPECIEGQACVLEDGIFGTCVDGTCDIDDILCGSGGSCPNGLTCVEVCDSICLPVPGETCEPQCWDLCQSVSDSCHATGCSGEVCSDREVVTTCEWQLEYECYRDAECARQDNGECGWTATTELEQCLGLVPELP
jgi:hypothetical protein